VIALHGWTGNSLSLRILNKIINSQNISWEFPQAPYKSGKDGYSWFNGNKTEGWDNSESMALLRELISKKLSKRVKHKNIFILGFSQGGCMALELIKKQNFSLGGIITIGGFLRDKSSFSKNITKQSKKTPVLIIHGKKDEVIKPIESDIIKNQLTSLGFKTKLKKFPCAHKIPLESKDLISSFILGF
tara:strand:- start:3028 stop:3591 length:564 start_codon:yes stop_codon:yes gene_type:complete